MHYLTADYIFPVSSPPLPHTVIAVDEMGFIAGILPANSALLSQKRIEKFDGILCPGFINAHCHLELSYLKGKISQKQGLPDFIGEIEAKRRNFSEEEIQSAIIQAEEEMLKNGIVGVGDICNSDFTFSQKTKGRIKYHSFIEALGFHPDKAEIAFERCLSLYRAASYLKISSSITPHAPYSASLPLLKKISDFALLHHSPISIHNQENEDENTMFIKGEGTVLERLRLLGIDISQWKPTGKSSLQSVFPYLPAENKLLLVHNTFTNAEDIQWLAADCRLPTANYFFCFCPNANRYIEDRLPDFKLFVKENCRITLGTDSLASNTSLSMLEELKVISAKAPEIPLQTLLCWATKNGADFYGWENELGTLERTKQPGINLIRNVDLKNLKLLENSEIERVV